MMASLCWHGGSDNGLGLRGGGRATRPQVWMRIKKAIPNWSTAWRTPPRPRTFRALYAKDKAPSSTEVAKYKGYMFYIRSDITITGTTATFTAGMEKARQTDIVEKPWTAVKEADGWKLSDTPTAVGARRWCVHSARLGRFLVAA